MPLVPGKEELIDYAFVEITHTETLKKAFCKETMKVEDMSRTYPLARHNAWKRACASSCRGRWKLLGGGPLTASHSDDSPSNWVDAARSTKVG